MHCWNRHAADPRPSHVCRKAGSCTPFLLRHLFTAKGGSNHAFSLPSWLAGIVRSRTFERTAGGHVTLSGAAPFWSAGLPTRPQQRLIHNSGCGIEQRWDACRPHLVGGGHQAAPCGRTTESPPAGRSVCGSCAMGLGERGRRRGGLRGEVMARGDHRDADQRKPALVHATPQRLTRMRKMHAKLLAPRARAALLQM